MPEVASQLEARCLFGSATSVAAKLRIRHSFALTIYMESESKWSRDFSPVKRARVAKPYEPDIWNEKILEIIGPDGVHYRSFKLYCEPRSL